MGARGVFRQFVFAAAVLASVQASAQIYIPPFDDDPDPVVMEPDISPPPVTTPGAPPPPPSQTPAMTAQQAREEAKIFGRSSRAANEDIPLREGAAGQIPFYEEAVPEQASHYQSPDTMAGAGMLASQTNEGFQTVNDSSRPVANVPRSELERALAIQEDPSAFLESQQISGTSGECQPLPAGTGSTEFAEFTCNIGTQVSGRDVQCQVTLDHHFNTQYRYTCTRLYEQGTYCEDDFRNCRNRISYFNEIGSACEAFAAPATGCSLLSSSAAYIGPSQYFDFGFFIGRTYLGTNVYSCPTQISGTISGYGYTLPYDPFAQYDPSFVEEAVASAYVNSTLNLSQCEAAANLACPSGYSLEGSACVSRRPADVGYSCEEGWTLSGDQCTLVSAVPGTIQGYQCPVGYDLDGTNCLKVQPATVSGFSCPPGYNLDGTDCVQVNSQPATIVGYNCPSGYIVNGSQCTRTDIIPATPSYSCPPGWALAGDICSRQESMPAFTNYTCPPGWFLDGDQCRQTASQPATLSGYTCEPGWTLNGTNCSRTTTIAATSNNVCPIGWALVGNECQQTSTEPAIPNYSCDAGYVLNGSDCTLTETLPASSSQSCNGLDPIGGLCSTIATTSTCPATMNGMTFNHSRNARGRLQCLYNPAIIYSCPSEYAVSGSSCVKLTTRPAAVTYSCSAGGVLSGTSCIITNSQPPVPEYSCPVGYVLSGSQCNLTETVPALPVYSCPSGMTLNGQMCDGNISQPADPSYFCSAGWNLVGGMCYRTESQPATPSYSCPPAYVVNGSVCELNEIIPGDPIYSCPIGFLLQVANCTSTLREPAIPAYSCPTDFVLDGEICRSSIPATVTGYDCPNGYTLNGQVCTLTQTKPATGGQSCPSGFVLTNAQCEDFQSPAPVGTECTAPVDICIDSTPVTRVINGVSITKPCWAWDRSYSCTTLTQGQNDCTDLESNASCRFDREICLDDPAPTNGNCQVSERIYLCPTGSTTPEPTQYVCGDDVYCINGECEAIEREPSTEFKDALVGLNALGQANAEFDESALTLFRGTRETCHKKVFGLSNCCSGKGVPVLTPWLCNSAEKELDRKDDAGLCKKVGTFCSDRVLGVCVTRKDAYCCFQSKISRILQEQGRPQIGKPWGAPRTEQCQGFTIEEFSRLDLSVMDFREVYAEFEDAVRLPNEAETLVDIQNRINAFYANNTGG